jgi:beta-galactosidase
VLDKAYENPKIISGAIGWCMFDYNTHKDFGAGDRICHHGVMDIFREPKFAAYVYTSQCSPAEQVVLEPVTYWARGEKDRCEVLPLIVLTNCDYVELQVGDFAPKRAEPDRELLPAPAARPGDL